MIPQHHGAQTTCGGGRRDDERTADGRLPECVTRGVEDALNLGTVGLLTREVTHADQLPVVVGDDGRRIVEGVDDGRAILEPVVEPPAAGGNGHEEDGQRIAAGGRPHAPASVMNLLDAERRSGEQCGIALVGGPREGDRSANDGRHAECEGAHAEHDGHHQHRDVGPGEGEHREDDLRGAGGSPQHALAEGAADQSIDDGLRTADEEKERQGDRKEFEGASQSQQHREAEHDPQRREDPGGPSALLVGCGELDESEDERAQSDVDREQQERGQRPRDDQSAQQQRETPDQDHHDRRSAGDQARQGVQPPSPRIHPIHLVSIGTPERARHRRGRPITAILTGWRM